MEEQLKLYSFYWSCGRMGSLDGLFVAKESELEKLFGETIYFGEVLGKHSEIYGELEKKDITLVSEDHDKILWLLSVLSTDSTISGYNPFDYYDPSDSEDDEEE